MSRNKPVISWGRPSNEQNDENGVPMKAGPGGSVVVVDEVVVIVDPTDL
jgi:hypothetical protein